MQTTIDLPDETVSLHELVRRAVQGDEIIISEAGNAAGAVGADQPGPAAAATPHCRPERRHGDYGG